MLSIDKILSQYFDIDFQSDELKSYYNLVYKITEHIGDAIVPLLEESERLGAKLTLADEDDTDISVDDVILAPDQA